MPSAALQGLRAALPEVIELGRVALPNLAASHRPSLSLARAIGRAQVVLLSSHFERYFYAVNEEAIAALNALPAQSDLIPLKLKLIHSAGSVDDLAKASWEHRADKLEKFVYDESWLWKSGSTGIFQHERLLTWMKAPNPSNLVRYYGLWEINDIFQAVTRSNLIRGKLRLSVQELVDKRNNIAHGDYSAQATQLDVRRYVRTVDDFCDRADRRLSRSLAQLLHMPKPW